MINLFFHRLSLAWEAFRYGYLDHQNQLQVRQAARIRLLEKYLMPEVQEPYRRPDTLPSEVLPYPHTGPTRTSFDS